MIKLGRRAALAFVLLWVSLQCAPLHGFQQPVIPSTPVTQSNKVFRTGSRINDQYPKTLRTDTSLSASPLVSAIGSPLGSVGVLAFVVLFHEAGHYLAARSLGISVEEFSVGIGPKLLGFKAFGNEFNLRALPLGGYVRFPENYNATQVMELQEAAMEQRIEEDGEQQENSVISGLMNVLTFGRLERKRAEDEAKRLVEEQGKEARNSNFFSNLFARKTNPKEEPSKPEKFEIEYYDDPNLLQNRPWPQRALVLSGGVLFNLLLAFLIFFGEINVGSGLPRPVFEQGAVVTSLARQGSPSSGILEPGDVIVKVNGELACSCDCFIFIRF